MAMDAANSVTPSAVALILANPSPDSAADLPKIVVQVVDLKPIGTRFTFLASDGKAKIKAMLPTHFASEVHSGNLQNLGLIRILDYTCNTIPNQSDKALIITKCEVVSQALEAEIKTEVKKEEEPAVLVMSRDDRVSNVGKSSLRNALTRQWGVVRTSDKPGLTQVKEYVSTRVGLERVCLLVHTKRGMKPLDYELVVLMERSNMPYQIVLTKTDLVFPIDVARRAMEIQELQSLKKKKSVKPSDDGELYLRQEPAYAN